MDARPRDRVADEGSTGSSRTQDDIGTRLRTYIDGLQSLSDRDLVGTVKRALGRERGATAAILSHLGEIERRNLYLASGFASMFLYCTMSLNYSEHSAYNRIAAARAARRFPRILYLIANGQLHLTAVKLLAPLLTEENHEELLASARNCSRREVEDLVARLRPRSAAIQLIRRLPYVSFEPAAPGSHDGPDTTIPVPADTPDRRTDGASPDDTDEDRSVTARSAEATRLGAPAAPLGRETHWETGDRISSAEPGIGPAGPGREPSSFPDDTAGGALVPVRNVAPNRTDALAHDLYRVQFTASGEMHERLRHAQELLRHKFPTGDIASILDLALRLLISKVEARKFGRALARDRSLELTRPETSSGNELPVGTGRRPSSVSDPSPVPAQQADAPTAHRAAQTTEASVQATPRAPRGVRPASRYLPLFLRRAVWKRDGARCAFVSQDGTRCASTSMLEFHHVDPFAWGGPSTISNVELRCRPHNQYEALLAFGADRIEQQLAARRAVQRAVQRATRRESRGKRAPTSLPERRDPRSEPGSAASLGSSAGLRSAPSVRDRFAGDRSHGYSTPRPP